MAKVPGSIFRRALFWTHLCCGVAAAIFIFIMSATGVLLAYESQILASRSEANRITLPADAVPLSADQLFEKARAAAPAGSQLNLAFNADPTRPVTANYGRQSLLLNPLTGAVMPDAAAGARGFFRTVENWHRWLGSDPRGTGASLMNLSNLLFLVLIIFGIYIWLPQVWKWTTVRGLVLFRGHYVNAKARDFSWHHVFSFWTFIPLFLIALSGVVGSYPWANSLLFAAYGEQAPQRGGPPGPPGQGGPGMNGPGMNGPGAAQQRDGDGPGGPGGVGGRSGFGGPGGAEQGGPDQALNAPRREAARRDDAGVTTARASAQQLLDAARARFVNSQSITIPADRRGQSVTLTAELKSAAPRAPRPSLTLSTRDASVIRYTEPSAANSTQSRGQRARAWFRFVHTGEQYGAIGQTVAALASLAACFLAYTGVALAWRRLIRPLFRRASESAATVN